MTVTVVTRTMKRDRDAPRSFADALASSSDDLQPLEQAMEDLVVGASPELLGDICAEHLAAGGKRLRARLALAAAERLGVARDVALHWAVACETMHNATLIHDDLQDGDRVRRGHPTTWVVHGTAQAINAGDLMLVLPFAALAQIPVDGALKWRLSRALAHRAQATVRGQAADLQLRKLVEGPAPGASYRRCIEGKTGALFALPVEGAALLAGKSPAQADDLAQPFVKMGMLFQLQDDVLDLYGDKGRGARGADLREGKISALVVEELRLHPARAQELFAVLDAPRDETPVDAVERVIAQMRDQGALDAVARQIHRLADDVEHAPALSQAPALRALAHDLVDLILMPIRHVIGPRSGESSE